MKKQLLVIGAVILFMTAFAAQGALAQDVRIRTVEIGFEFHVGKDVYPSGRYVIEKLDSKATVFQLRNIVNGRQRLLFAGSIEALETNSPRLVFQSSGGNYYLSQIFLQTGSAGFEVAHPKGKRVENDSRLAQIRQISIPVKSE